MRLLYLTSVWLHIIAAAVWVGGMTFLVLALVPVLKRPQYRDIASSLVQLTGIRFRTIGWITMGVLVTTGFINLTFRDIGAAELISIDLWQTSFGQTLGIKLLLVSIILLTSAFHDFYVGPKATAAWQANSLDQANRFRKWARWFGRANLIVGLVVMALGVMLVRGGLW